MESAHHSKPAVPGLQEAAGECWALRGFFRRCSKPQQHFCPIHVSGKLRESSQSKEEQQHQVTERWSGRATLVGAAWIQSRGLLGLANKSNIGKRQKLSLCAAQIEAFT